LAAARAAANEIMLNPQKLYTFHDADVAFRAVAERIERGLVAGRIMRGGRRRHAVELDHDAALVQPGLIGFRRRAARQELSARRLDRGPASFA